ncbi:NAD-dependent glycerol-3-phosphate dehydrogenase [Streptomyces albus]|uniref:NAD-dependent glycerol-3-phosphate dehydrogenase n=1 Tax=Streptomyces albus (strain ATCC 21838 / DSM 41398 / FERM P-419 / JCM 4703 / NBRC 107858) TaxID=1081613 RepID=A0A0B5EWU4_STRA4|nr:NAD-dependent glycerol-3-phosphate dehydrogenase [Streptomyces albus]AOU76906.1 NAD-dependent glycerol-3-phosphate dehydrogenase [Streptomyces albus]
MAGTDRTPVTVIGLGLMGQALASAFVAAGHPTTVWNRSADKAAAVVEQGTVLADTPAEAVAASELLVVCLLDNDAVHAVLDPVAGSLAGRVVANLTSGSSDQARENAAWAEEVGFRYLDAAIMTVPAAVGAPESVVFYSGPREAYDRHSDTLRLLGGGTTHLGEDHALSALYDVSLLGVMWGTLNSFLQGAALLSTAEVKAADFLPLALKWIDTVKLFATDYAAQIDQKDGAFPANDATMEVHLGAVRHLLHESEAQGVNAELPRFVHALMERTVAKGFGQNSYASMSELFRTPEK